MKVAIFGAGRWGTALAIITSKAGNDVVLWSYDGDCAKLDSVEMPREIEITKDMHGVGDADTWLIVTPAVYFRETLKKSRPFYNKQPIIVCTKGIEFCSSQFMAEIVDQELPECKDYGVLSGPQFATEVATDVPTGSTFAGSPNILSIGDKILNKLYLEKSDDIIGTEICGVGKNAVALIAGYASITAAGENERALIFTRAWNEVLEFGIASGAKIRTFLGLCGIGDLFLSATSTTSRNYSAGIALAQGAPVNGTVEGIFALQGLIHRAGLRNVSMPVLTEMWTKIFPLHGLAHRFSHQDISSPVQPEVQL